MQTLVVELWLWKMTMVPKMARHVRGRRTADSEEVQGCSVEGMVERKSEEMVERWHLLKASDMYY
jgi:hypothetical protein